MAAASNTRSTRGGPAWLAGLIVWCALATILVATSTCAIGCGDSKKLRVATSGLPLGRVSASYQANLVAGGQEGPVTWQLISALLPPGLTLNSATGVILGTPSSPGTYSFGVAAFDGKDSAFAGLTIEVIP